MVHDHPHGKPENVLEFSADSKLVIDSGPMKKMFEHSNVKNRHIVAFSIIGAYRKGKSFFLDYCLRFLYAHYPSINYPNNPVSAPTEWMGDENQPLEGFTWRSGAVRDTTGIVMWNDIFLHTDEMTGKKIAIVVMDTQGLFDNETSQLDNSRIFALGTLISSIQVLNLSGVVQEDQLLYLQFATEFAKFAANDSQGTAGKPFQSLLFLIRDWSNPEDYAFGITGGESYLKFFLKVKNEQKDEMKSVRQFIYSSFEQLSCFLLPHPGKTVAGGKRTVKKYDGQWGEMDDDFKDELVNLIEHLLMPNQLVLKKINSKDLIGTEFLGFTEQYFKLFQSDELPQAQSIYESTIEKQMMIIVSSCFNNYKQTIFKNHEIISNVSQIPILHEMSKNQTLLMYKDTKKMGNLEHELKFKRILEEQIDNSFKNWNDQSMKNIKKIEEEKEKTRLALEEIRRLELVQIENEKKAYEKLRELERLKVENFINEQKYLNEIEIGTIRLKAEKDRLEALKAEKLKDDDFKTKVMAQIDELKNKLEHKPKKKCSIL